MHSKPLVLLLLGVFSLVLGGSSAAQTDNEPANTETRSAGSPSNSLKQLDDERHFHVGDEVSFRIVEDGDAAVSLTVSDSGQIQVPYVGSVFVLNKTPRQTALEIKKALESSLYKNATVWVSLEKRSVRSPGRVFLSGEVNRQGSLELRPDERLTVSQAISEAGGFSDFANKRKVKVVRKSTRTPTQIVVDVAEIVNKGRLDLDVPLEAGDVIVVPARLINW